MGNGQTRPSAVIEGDFFVTSVLQRRKWPAVLLLALSLAILIAGISTIQLGVFGLGLVLTVLSCLVYRRRNRVGFTRLRLKSDQLSITGAGYQIHLVPPYRYKTGVQRIPATGKADETCFVRMVLDVNGRPLVLEEQVLQGHFPPKLDEITGLGSALGIAELSSCTPFPGTLWSLVQYCEATTAQRKENTPDQNIEALYRQGMRQIEEKSFAQAVDTFTSLIRLRPDSASAYLHRGLSRYHDRRNLDNAVNDLTTALRLDPAMSEVYRIRALVHALLEDWVAMRDDCTIALKMQPNSAELLSLRGTACYRLRDYGAAIFNCDHAIRLKGNSPESYYNRGLAKLQKQMLAEALTDFRYALQLNPRFEAATRSIISVQNQLNHLGAAKSGRAAGPDMNPTSSSVHENSSR